MAAEELLRFALFKEVIRPERRKRRKLNGGGQADSEDEDETDAEEELEEEQEAVDRRDNAASPREQARRKARQIEQPSQPSQPDDDDVAMGEAEASGSGEVSSERVDLFRARLSAVFESDAASAGYIDFEDLLPKINEDMALDELFGSREARAAVQAMNDRNEVMFSDGTVYKV